MGDYITTTAMADRREDTHVDIADELDPALEEIIRTDPQRGLTDAEVQERLVKFGKNGMSC